MDKIEHEREVWLRLAKFQEGGATLSPKAAEVFEKLSSENPHWKIREDEQDEFPIWMNVGEGALEQIESPEDLESLVQWLKANPKSSMIKDDDWRDRCRTDVRLASDALRLLDRDGAWLPDRVQDALNVWATDQELLSKSWSELNEYLESLSQAKISEIVRSLSHWLQAIAAVLKRNDPLFFKLVEKILDLPPIESGMRDDPLTVAINHPVGHVAGALLRCWDWNRREGKRGIQGEVRELMSRICDADVEKFRNGRVVLARSVVALLAEDKEWAVSYMIPLFDWTNSEVEAVSVWTGFLNSPRGNPDLFFFLKEPFLEIREHLPEFDEEYREQFIRFLTIIGLSKSDTISDDEMRDIFGELDLQQLGIAAQTMSNAMEGAADKSAIYWKEVWYPFFQAVWPKRNDKISQETAGRFAEVCVDAGEAFPHAVETLKDYLVPIQWPDFVVDKLKEKDLHKNFPSEALEFLSRIVGIGTEYPGSELRVVLQEIGEKDPKVRKRSAFRRLSALFD